MAKIRIFGFIGKQNLKILAETKKYMLWVLGKYNFTVLLENDNFYFSENIILKRKIIVIWETNYFDGNAISWSWRECKIL